MSNYSNPNHQVLEAFAGTCPSVFAAIHKGRNVTLVEKNGDFEHFFLERWNDIWEELNKEKKKRKKEKGLPSTSADDEDSNDEKKAKKVKSEESVEKSKKKGKGKSKSKKDSPGEEESQKEEDSPKKVPSPPKQTAKDKGKRPLVVTEPAPQPKRSRIDPETGQGPSDEAPAVFPGQQISPLFGEPVLEQYQADTEFPLTQQVPLGLEALTQQVPSISEEVIPSSQEATGVVQETRETVRTPTMDYSQVSPYTEPAVVSEEEVKLDYSSDEADPNTPKNISEEESSTESQKGEEVESAKHEEESSEQQKKSIPLVLSPKKLQAKKKGIILSDDSEEEEESQKSGSPRKASPKKTSGETFAVPPAGPIRKSVEPKETTETAAATLSSSSPAKQTPVPKKPSTEKEATKKTSPEKEPTASSSEVKKSGKPSLSEKAKRIKKKS